MAYVTKFDGRTDKTIKLGGEGNPSSIEGYFMGSKDVPSDYGVGKLHLFQTHEGVVGVWGKTRMNNLLTEQHLGQMVLVSFTGMIQPSKKGRRPSYGYKLQFDPANTIDVSQVDLKATPTADADEDDSKDATYRSQPAHDEPEADEESSYDEIEPARPVAPKVAAPALDAERKARMQALLKKGTVAPR